MKTLTITLSVLATLIQLDVNGSAFHRPGNDIPFNVSDYSLMRGHEDSLADAVHSADSATPIRIVLNEALAENIEEFRKFRMLLRTLVIKELILDLDSIKIGDFYDGFLTDTHYIEAVSFVNAENLKRIKTAFLGNNKKLKKVSFENLGDLTYVERTFLSGNPSLTDVDFKGLEKLMGVGSRSINQNHSLVSISLKGLSALRVTGHYFLSNNKKLTTVNFQGLDALENLRAFALSDNPLLTKVDLSPLKALKSIEGGFLRNSPVKTIYVADQKQKDLVEPHAPNANIIIRK